MNKKAARGFPDEDSSLCRKEIKEKAEAQRHFPQTAWHATPKGEL